MPAARVNSGPRHVRASRVFVVIVHDDGRREMTEVLGASLTVEAQYADIAWWQADAFATAHHSLAIRLEGIMGQGVAYSGDLPDEQAAISEPRRELESGA